MKILVTGGSGYIASWVIKYLLEEGHAVNTTVRDIDKTSKYEHLKKIAANSSGALEIFEANLLEDGSFDNAVKGCDSVIHMASPFFITNVKDSRRQLVEPAVKGTRNVIQSAEKEEKVKKIVITSSVAAIYGNNTEIDKTKNNKFTEAHWNKTSDNNYQAYNYSKTEAEKEAWRLNEEQERWDLAVINPGFVLGPSLTKRTDSTSINFILSLLDGKFKQGVPNMYFGIVDVRDVAKAHIKAAVNLNVTGRHILVSDSMSAINIAQSLREHVGASYPIPEKTLPKALIYLFGPFQGFSWKFVRNNIGVPIYFDNAKARQKIGIHFKNPKTTLKEQAQQLIDDGLIETKK